MKSEKGNKKRILFINGNLNVGGVEKSLVSILQAIDYSKYEVDLLLVENGGKMESDIPSQVNIMVKSMNSAYGPLKKVFKDCFKNKDAFSFLVRTVLVFQKLIGKSAYRIFGRILKLDHYDTCIGFRTGMSSDLAIYGVRADKKILWWHHGEINVDRSYEKTVKKSDCLVAVSEYCKKMLSVAFPEIMDKIIVIPNMINEERLLRLSQECSPNFPDSKTIIVSVGRLSWEKKYDLAVCCAKFLADKGYSFDWFLIGNGPELLKLKEMVRELKLEDRFHFLGELSNPYPYVLKADVFAHPSYMESQGISVLEALALKKPVVVMECGGVQEFVQNYRNGLVCRKNSNDFNEQMERIISDEKCRELLTRYSGLPKQFTEQEVITKIEQII